MSKNFVKGLPNPPSYLIPKINSKEDIVLRYFKERLPKEWRGIITYEGPIGGYQITFDWLKGEEHLAIRLLLPDFKKYFKRPPEPYTKALMALAKLPDYIPELTEEAKEDFDDMIQAAKEQNGLT